MLKTDGLAGVLQSAMETPEVGLAFVFGSVARGDAGAGSDVDLVIGEVGLRRLATLISGIGGRVGRRDSL